MPRWQPWNTLANIAGRLRRSSSSSSLRAGSGSPSTSSRSSSSRSTIASTSRETSTGELASGAAARFSSESSAASPGSDNDVAAVVAEPGGLRFRLGEVDEPGALELGRAYLDLAAAAADRARIAGVVCDARFGAGRRQDRRLDVGFVEGQVRAAELGLPVDRELVDRALALGWRS